jgi:hypothetical protein
MTKSSAKPANRLTAKTLQGHRAKLLEEQGGMDPIAAIPITAPALDHDHSTGHCRAVLQREINAFEGKVFNAYRRYVRHLGVSLDAVLLGLVVYHSRDWSQEPMHPTFRTDDEKRIRRNKKAKKRRADKKP